LEETLIGKGFTSFVPLLCSGLAHTLKVLRERGVLGKVVATGRAKDKTQEHELAKFRPAPSDRIILEYKDEKGKFYLI
jgi:hypothetical protein